MHFFSFWSAHTYIALTDDQLRSLDRRAKSNQLNFKMLKGFSYLYDIFNHYEINVTITILWDPSFGWL